MWWCLQTTLAIRHCVLVSLSVVMIQTGMTTGQSQPNNVGFVHPIATDIFPVNHPTGEQQQPAEEDLTSTAPSVEPVQTSPVKQPQFQVPVTLPFVMQRPPKPSAAVGKPSSYLRPAIMVDPISQDEQPIRQTKPSNANLPQEEDLSSPPGVAVTLPFRTKPASYLRPVFLLDEINEPSVGNEPPAVVQTKPFYYFPTRNVAVTLPFDLRPVLNGVQSEKKNPVKSTKPSSYLRPVLVTDEGAELTPEGDDYNHYSAPAEEDLTSPISGASTVQPSPPNNAVAVTIPFIQQPGQPVKVATKAASYLRPWFVDDSYVVAPVRATKPWRPQEVIVAASPAVMAAQIDDDDSASSVGYYQQRPAVTWLPYRAAGSPAVMRAPNSVRPLVYRRPIANSHGYLDDVQQPSGGRLRPLIAGFLPAVEDIKQQRPWIVQVIAKYDWPGRETKPSWFVPVISHQSGLIPMVNVGATSYQVVKTLIALPDEVYRHPIKEKKRPWILPAVTNVQSSIAGAGQAEARVPFLVNWATHNNNNLEKTHVIGNSTLVYTKQNLLQTGTSTVYTSTVFTATTTVQNAYCFVSTNQGLVLLPPTPWCSFRRKRSSSQMEEESSFILSIDGQTIEPSQVQKILMTALPSIRNDEQVVASSMRIEEDVPEVEGKMTGRLLHFVTNVITGRPTTTVTVTALTMVTEIAITDTTRITFAGGQCIPRCLQNLPACGL